MKTRNVAMMLSVALAASAARAVNYTWNSSSGGDLLGQTNYTPEGLPTASDTVTYNIDANYRLTASGDVPSHGPQTFSKGEIELDLGGHVWDAGSKYFYLNNPLLTLSSGMLTNLSQLVVSRTSPNARLVVTNGSTFKVSGQVVVGYDASSSHGGIVVADEGTTFSAVGGTVIGASGPFSALTVSDGARYSDANLTIGNVPTAVSNIVQVLNGSTVDTVSLEVKTHGNALIISNGSHVTASSAVIFAKATCSSNRLEVWAGSTLHAGATKKPFAFGVGPDNVMLVDASSISVADTSFTLGADATGSGNRLDVRNGSSFHVDSWIACAGSFNEMHFSDPGTEIVSESQLLIGQPGVGNVVSIENQASASVFGVSVSYSAGSQSNVLEVADGARVDVNGKDLQIGVGGGASRLTIDGASVTNMATVKMGANGNRVGTSDNLLEIVNGGRLFANSTVYFGGVGNSNNVIRVAGAGSVLKNHDSYMSWAPSSTNTVMYVEDAALVDIATTLTIGGAGGSGNAMIVSNATVKAGNAVSVNGVANLDIIGSGSSLTTSSDFTLLTADATLRFVSDDEGFGKVVSGNRLNATEGAKLVIDGARVAKSGGGTFELLVGPELTKQYNTSNPLVNNVTLVPEDSELIVTRDAKQNIVNVSVRVPSKRPGIVVIVR